MSHACPVKNCPALAKDEHLMCWPHWRRVPRILQRAVWDTFRRYYRLLGMARRQLPEDIRAEVREARDQYMKARADAIAAVEAKEAS